jgi:glycosyltransferase involved in cell wall biosynthesis
LLDTLTEHIDANDEIVVIVDTDVTDNKKTKEIAENYFQSHPAFVHPFDHPLSRNYGAHKDWGARKCSGDWIFQIDGDECPTETLLLNIKDIIEANPGIELIYVPRINDYKGVTDIHSRQWGWKLSPCPVCDNRPIVNWPDFQGRIYKNEPDRIKWDRRLHEKIVGHRQYTFLPEDYDLALYHDKTIEKQLDTNKRYNVWFTEEENRGHKVI